MHLKNLFSLLHLTLVSLASVSASYRTWNPVIVSANVLYDPTLQNATHSAESDLVCSMKASRYSWANLFCFSAGSCFISSLKTVPRHPPYNVTSPVDCMTTLNYGCLQENGTITPNSAFYAPNSCSKFLCNNGVFEQIEPATCPFNLVKGYGCYKYVSASATVVASRGNCPTFGSCAELAEFVDVVDPTFIPFVASALNITQSFWIGFNGVSNTTRIWTWTTSKLPVTLNPAMWAPGYPSDAVANAGLADSANLFKYRQEGGSPITHPYLCEVKGNF